MAHILYRFYSATGQLLYVGITMNPVQRFKAHRKSKDWWLEVAGISIEHYGNREDLAKAERRTIRIEHPLYNVVHTKAHRAEAVIAEPAAPPTSAIDDDLASLFTPAPPPPVLAPTVAFNWYSQIFAGSSRRDTCFGYVTEDEYKRLAEADRARWSAIDECKLCDDIGYRNRRVCNHIERTSPLQEARKRLLEAHAGGVT